MGSDIQSLIASWPRQRPALPPAHAARYVEEYRINRGQRGGLLYRAVAGAESWMHRQVAAAQASGDILELGAGTLNHLPYEPGAAAYDIVEPFRTLYEGSERLDRVRRRYADIGEIPAASRYGRILSVAVLEHVLDLARTVARSGLLLAPGGAFQAAIPSEGGALWGAAWRLSTALAYRLRTGLPYRPVMRHEHVNRAPEIVALVRHLFGQVEVRRFPLPAHHLSLYCYIEAREPRLDRCRELAGAP